MRVLRLCSTLIVIGALGSLAENFSASMAMRQMNLQQIAPPLDASFAAPCSA